MMMPYELTLPKCRIMFKAQDGRVYQCPHPVKYAAETRCEDCFVEAQLPHFFRTRTVAFQGGRRIVERTKVEDV